MGQSAAESERVGACHPQAIAIANSGTAAYLIERIIKPNFPLPHRRQSVVRQVSDLKSILQRELDLARQLGTSVGLGIWPNWALLINATVQSADWSERSRPPRRYPRFEWRQFRFGSP